MRPSTLLPILTLSAFTTAIVTHSRPTSAVPSLLNITTSSSTSGILHPVPQGVITSTFTSGSVTGVTTLSGTGSVVLVSGTGSASVTETSGSAAGVSASATDSAAQQTSAAASQSAGASEVLLPAHLVYSGLALVAMGVAFAV
ncbi:hypothetical protein LTR53_015220 [Teratosphaeriaceae sp. CCFEE 6253]|nr:hypothetical protein LTR53_015220 [Teratosphaeriaceae sp. CCFEE 6253]